MLRTVAFTMCDICTSNMLGGIWIIKTQGKKMKCLKQSKTKQGIYSH